MEPVLYPQDVEARRPQIMPVLEREQIELMRSFGGPPRRFAPGELVIAAKVAKLKIDLLEGQLIELRPAANTETSGGPLLQPLLQTRRVSGKASPFLELGDQHNYGRGGTRTLTPCGTRS